MHGRHVGLEVTELLLLLGVQPPLTTSLFWRFVKAAVFVGHAPVSSHTGWRSEPCEMSPLLLLVGLGLGGYLAVWRNKRSLKVKTRRRR